ncbi:MAG TPA: sigma-70 family RNA polymerase sigma factor [Marmoricola sp.]|jgi:RNA polymerase sigma factor (sigma-70 family)|nr:sigma-70 family RNA polymerase sigma factor [Marmoricola sp.]
MTVMERAPGQGELSDAELISSVRGGDVSSYGDLFARHRDAATRLARQLVSAPDADDLVSEAFAKVLNVLLAGGGPDVAFRAYLLTAVRRLHVDKIRATSRAMPTDDLTVYDQGEPFKDTVIAGFEGGAAAKAYASLPERWQLVLWHLEVEGQKPAEVAPLLGMTPNSVSALAYRAREGLRQAYLQMHSADISDTDCRWVHDKMGAYVRKGLSRRDAAKVEEHLRTCRKCTALFVELSEVNSSMAGVIGPVVLGTATMAYLDSIHGVGALGGFGGAVGKVLAKPLAGALAALSRAWESVQAQGRVVIGIGGGLAVAGLATFVVLVANSGGPNGAPITSDTPIGTTTGIPTPTPTATPTRHHHPKPSKTTSTIDTGGFVASASSSPTSTPSKHHTKPTKTPTSPVTVVTPPPTGPTTTPITDADISVRLAFQPKLGLLGAPNAGTLGNLNADVTGVPEGTTGMVTVSIVGGSLSPLGTGCTETGLSTTVTCMVGPDAPPLVFKVNGIPVTASAEVTAPDTVEDPQMNNNRDALLLGLL